VPRLVLGIGNILLGDEGVGVRIVEALRERAMPEDVEVADGGTGGADLVDLMADRRKVIVIDAAEFDGRPGDILRFTAADLGRRESIGLSLHDLGLAEALTMMRHLGCAPEEVVIFGIKPKRIAPGLDLTAEVAATVPKVIERVLEELDR
jgi:hydrogenase maturation protease